MPSNHLILPDPLLLLPSIFLSIKVFSNESDLSIRWPSTEASVLQCATYFMVQLSNPYMTTRKTIALTIVSDLCQKSDISPFYFFLLFFSLLFNTRCRFVIAFLQKEQMSKFHAAVTVHSASGAQENKICDSSHCFPIYLP